LFILLTRTALRSMREAERLSPSFGKGTPRFEPVVGHK